MNDLRIDATLKYWNYGDREYVGGHTRLRCRNFWEFQAVVRGRCAPTLSETVPTVHHKRRLWVFPAATAHGWHTPPGRTCEIVVMHFAQVPTVLRVAAERRGYLSVPLTPAEAQRIRALCEQVRPEYEHPSTHSMLHFEQALIALTLQALKGIRSRPLQASNRLAEHKIDQAMCWFVDNLAAGPTVADMARAVHLSPTHLRRLFRQVGQGSPLARMNAVRMREAQNLMAESEMAIAQISEAVGFSEPSAFTRAFKHQTGLTPRVWRRRHQRESVPRGKHASGAAP